jgi:hypothetical protein
MRDLAVKVLLVVMMVLASAARLDAETMTSTLTLDSLSFVSFQNEEVLLLPGGSSIRFHFASVQPDGTLPFTIDPADITIPPIGLPGTSDTLAYGIAEPASGTIRTTSSGRVIEFTAKVTAALSSSAGGAFTYSMPFTTETTSATNLAGNLSIEVTGMRLVEGVWYAQIVGATVNQANAYPKPGTAVYTVLSGQFDQLPE